MQHLDFNLVYSPAQVKAIQLILCQGTSLDAESSYLDKVTDELEESIIMMVKNKESAGKSTRRTL